MTSSERNVTTSVSLPRRDPTSTAAAPVMGLAILWSQEEPDRVGEVALLPAGSDDAGFAFGRLSGSLESGVPLELMRQRPGENQQTGPLRSSRISRVQWLIRRSGRALSIENRGRRGLLHNGQAVDSARAAIGDLVEVADELLAMVIMRPPRLTLQGLPTALVPAAFGGADEFGNVGESTAAWELRRQLAFAAGRDDHVLITGPSGSGKELAARAIHGLSRRAGKKQIARNAATFPEGLIDAELFGNARDFPNAGMPERPGVIGAADESSLFLDEIGELPHALQAHLLRLLDGGEYHRLGDARPRRADVRVIAATNRPPAALKHDLLARLRLRVNLPGLDQRREDVPLIARHLLRSMAASDPVLARGFFVDGDAGGEPRWTAAFVAALVAAPYATHVRELGTSLWQAMSSAAGNTLDAPRSGAPAAPAPEAAAAAAAAESVDPRNVTAAQIRAALEASAGSRERAWRALGLRSRHQLMRLLRKHDIALPPTGDPDD